MAAERHRLNRLPCGAMPPRLLMIEATIPVGNADELVMLLGASDQHLRRIRDSVPAKIQARDGKIHVSGDEQAVLQATEIIEQIKNAVGRDRRRFAGAGHAHYPAGDGRTDQRPPGRRWM